ncbi:MAG: VIT1/CCC1 transporter family protein [Bacteroidales bacterium]|nr:VIT1/CCC1 transporter family protein [Bacteroidales bacterium]MDD2611253.1 VIT1/CCC1 transporter family protein [Bacteroidales bacterium]MDD4712321.1 VIT1/CCC1 transporter family protein [Bacteroidales bacterium]
MDDKSKKIAISAQKTEITEHHIYLRIADRCKDKKNAALLREIGMQELTHAKFWQSKTGIEVKPDKWKVFSTVFLARLLGLSFILKQMEKNEGTGSKRYSDLSSTFPETNKLSEEEGVHEKEILGMLDEEKLQYVGSIVLGLNDALVELTGSLAGFTLALGDTRTISLAGLVTGISAALSMASSDYLSSKAEGDATAKKSAIYTGVTYFFTVILLILPFLLFTSKFMALGVTLLTAVIIIFCFNYYIAIAKDLNFKERFLEMTFISLGVAGFSFLLGYLLKIMLGVDA